MATLSIKLGRAGTGSIVLDGHDIADATCGVRLDSKPGNLTSVQLDVLAHEVVGVEVESPRLYLPDATRDLLLRHGWTPPAEGVDFAEPIAADGGDPNFGATPLRPGDERIASEP